MVFSPPGVWNAVQLTVTEPGRLVEEHVEQVVLVVVRQLGQIERLGDLEHVDIEIRVALIVFGRVERRRARRVELGGHVVLVAHGADLDVDAILLAPLLQFVDEFPAFPGHDLYVAADRGARGVREERR